MQSKRSGEVGRSGRQLLNNRRPREIRILFMVSADAHNTNAQSLNAREIALRLDPLRFASTLFFEDAPESRLLDRPSIRLVKLPRRRRTLRMLKEMLLWPDLIAYVDWSPAAYLFLHLPRMLRGRAVTICHVEAPIGQLAGTPKLLQLLYHGIVPRCDVHTAITKFIVREMADNLGLKAKFVLPVGVDTQAFVPPAARQSATPSVLFVGTVMERKGPHSLVEAAAQLPGVQFRIVGPARNGFDEVLRARCRDAGVKNVQLLGPQSQASIVALMQGSDVFVLPSRLEGLPKVTLEAAATGLPCIVFRDYETPSVLDGVTGFQVATVEEMVSRLRLLIEDPQLRASMGAAAIQHAKKYDWDVIVSRWQEAYLQAAEPH